MVFLDITWTFIWKFCVTLNLAAVTQIISKASKTFRVPDIKQVSSHKNKTALSSFYHQNIFVRRLQAFLFSCHDMQQVNIGCWNFFTRGDWYSTTSSGMKYNITEGHYRRFVWYIS